MREELTRYVQACIAVALMVVAANIVLAWILAAYAPSTAYVPPEFLSASASFLPPGATDGWDKFEINSEASVRRFGMRTITTTFEVESDGLALMFKIRCDQFGFPFYCLNNYSFQGYFAEYVQGKPPSLNTATTRRIELLIDQIAGPMGIRSGIELPRPPSLVPMGSFRAAPLTPDRYLPVHPMISGLLGNVFLLGIFPTIVYFAWKKYRLAIRYQYSRCLDCGYELRGNAHVGCPECGWNRQENEQKGTANSQRH